MIGAATPATLRLKDLTKLFGTTRAVDRVSMTIEPGSMVALLGPSGCGKTTTLRMVAGLIEPSAGEIFLDERPITSVPVHRRNIGMLFQNYALFPHMTVAENIAFGLETRGIRGRDAADRVAAALQMVQLPEYGSRLPAALSGGQQQRVALARALVVEPILLLLDEPLGALDKALRESMQVELRALQRRLGITTVMVTHDQDEALTMADRIVIMRDGRIEQAGEPGEIYLNPVSRFVAGFLGASNFLRGRVVERAPDQIIVEMPGGLSVSATADRPVGSEVTLALRPEAVTIEVTAADAEAARNAAAAQVEQVIYHGFATHFHLRLRDGAPLIAFEQNRDRSAPQGIAPGSYVVARWAADSARVVRDAAD
ncbi:MAG: ABC transporter ATP-binding protein [Alphaproteobacteria bacterium]|nr:ABC transporter ATP-binding protein [Alphaproteobacteria bacterium]